MDHHAGTLHVEWNTGFVALSYLIAAIAAYFSINFTVWNHAQRDVTHLARGVLLGSGVWAMHFIGMLAFQSRATISYDPALTVLSWFVPVVLMSLAFDVLGRPGRIWMRLGAAAAISGTGIVGMHYLGVFAMNLHPYATFHLGPFLLSVTIAILVSSIALGLLSTLEYRWKRTVEGEIHTLTKIGASLVMAGAIAGMHYVGMHAFTYHGVPTLVSQHPLGLDRDSWAMGVMVAVLTLCLASEVLVATQQERNLLEEPLNTER